VDFLSRTRSVQKNVCEAIDLTLIVVVSLVALFAPIFTATVILFANLIPWTTSFPIVMWS
jgi:hypothetical protein